MSRDDIRKAFPALDEHTVDLIADSGVSVPLVADVVAALRKHGHRMPRPAAEHLDASARTIRAIAGLVNAHEGRDPFGALPAPTSLRGRASALKQQLHALSPVAHADEYRSLFAELVAVEAEISAGRDEPPAPVLPAAEPRPHTVRAQLEVHVDDLVSADALTAPGEGGPIRIVVGHLPQHLSLVKTEAVRRAAYWRSDVTLVGSGPGLAWLRDSVAEYLAQQHLADLEYERGTSAQ